MVDLVVAVETFARRPRLGAAAGGTVAMTMRDVSVPRLWISPAGQVIDLGDGGDGHGMWVAKDPERFGLPAGHFDEHLAAVNDIEQDVEFDFDAAIVVAESRGWARVSRDAKSGVAIAAGTVRAARRAALLLVDRGVRLPGLDLEIECVRDDCIEAVTFRLDREEVVAFLDSGRLTQGKRHSLPLSAPELTKLERCPAPAM